MSRLIKILMIVGTAAFLLQFGVCLPKVAPGLSGIHVGPNIADLFKNLPF